MKRNIDLNEISDGRLYSSGDMVKADCHDSVFRCVWQMQHTCI